MSASLQEKERRRPEKNVELTLAVKVEEEREPIFASVPMFKGTWIVKPLLTPNQCETIIHAAETVGFGATPYPKSYRGNTRVIIRDVMLAKNMWPLLASNIPRVIKDKEGTWEVQGLNSWWRIAKYWEGDRFERHVDGVNRVGALCSKITVNIYLNEEYVGGHTRLYQGGKPVVKVRGTTGSALLFLQPPVMNLLHDGSEVMCGNKYLMRTDVMYRKIG